MEFHDVFDSMDRISRKCYGIENGTEAVKSIQQKTRELYADKLKDEKRKILVWGSVVPDESAEDDNNQQPEQEGSSHSAAHYKKYCYWD
ncbi:hypothetical protein QR680_010644 [Steinernema hermaphroditum]|nr:hypothetical protein QR680_010644 [Steinernema hermaphroditum]